MQLLLVLYAAFGFATFALNLYRVLWVFQRKRGWHGPAFWIDSGALAAGMAVVWPFQLVAMLAEWGWIRLRYADEDAEDASTAPQCATLPIRRMSAEEHEAFCNELFAVLAEASNAYTRKREITQVHGAGLSAAHVHLRMAWSVYAAELEDQGHERHCARHNFLGLASEYAAMDPLEVSKSPPDP